MQQAWDQAWVNARPALDSIRDSLSQRTSSDPRIMRVGQLDSELLDQELVNILQEPLSKSFALVNSSLKARFEPELALLIQLTLYKLSIWNLGASYGAKLQDLRYTVPQTSACSLTRALIQSCLTALLTKLRSASGLPRRTLLAHGTLTIIVPYLHNRLRTHALSHAWPDAPSNDRRRKAWDILARLESIHMTCGLISFVAFLWDGRHRTIADRILGMRLEPSRRLVKRDVSYEFMNRQMVWHAFTEFLLFLLPLVSARAIRRGLFRFISRVKTSANLSSVKKVITGRDSTAEKVQTAGRAAAKQGKYWALPRDQCAICAENASFSLNLSEPENAFTSLTVAPTRSMEVSDVGISAQESEPTSSTAPTHPINTPYITSCGHIYCYHCLTERMMRSADDGVDESGWECLRCEEGVRASERWAGDIAQEYDGSDWDGDGLSSISEFESGTESFSGYSISDTE
ncbi:hypothetical protein HWV62_18302 [Athelia sp. TMB]|nr:hypothetical protein HWV62_18302 [Athelia sp. TMB]